MMTENYGIVYREKQATIRRISAAQTHELRALVLRPGQPPDATVFLGDYVTDTLHLGAFERDKLVGIATIIHQAPENYMELNPEKVWLLRGMATLFAVRGRGYGAALMHAACAYVARLHGRLLWCDARVGAIGFYEKMGFVIQGNRFNIPGSGLHTGPH